VRYPSLQITREAIDELRKERAAKRRERRERFDSQLEKEQEQ
jgi:hypothetical protein